jgi:hypothetical protein
METIVRNGINDDQPDEQDRGLQCPELLNHRDIEHELVGV